MQIAEVFAQYMEHLLAGKRCESRELITATLDRGVCARKLIQYVVWPAMVQIERLYAAGKISRREFVGQVEIDFSNLISAAELQQLITETEAAQ